MKNSRLELDKILSAVSSYAVLEAGKRRVLETVPTESLPEARRLLDMTEEAVRLLFDLGGSSRFRRSAMRWNARRREQRLRIRNCFPARNCCGPRGFYILR